MNDYDLNLDSPGPEQSNNLEKPKWNKPRKCKRCSNLFIPKHSKQAYCGCSKSNTTQITEQTVEAVILELQQWLDLPKPWDDDKCLKMLIGNITIELAKNST